MKNKEYRIASSILVIMILLCMAVCFIGGFPDLPTAQQFPADAAAFLETASFLPVVIFCCFTVVISACLLYFGIVLHRSIRTERGLSNACIVFSIFVLISGIWILTDSGIFFLLCDHVDAVVLISFIAFMLMPIVFLDSLNFLYELNAFQIMRRLFSANLILFLIFVIGKANQVIYLFSLAIHHILIFIFVFLCVTKYFRGVVQDKSVRIDRIPLGIVLFFVFVVISIALFLLGQTDFYSISLAVGLFLLICSILRLMLDRSVNFYKEQMHADFYKKMAYIDTLTGVQNRNAFHEDQQATADIPTLCYVIFDINNLKNINDQYGHHVGDSLICAAGRLMQDCFSGIGQCYRIGGDEFAVICAGQEETSVKAALHKLEQSIAQHNSENQPIVKLSVAYGYAFRETPETSINALFKKADDAMYLCKSAQKASGPC